MGEVPPSLIVFDLDGTLIDSRRDLADAANALLVECAAPSLAEEDIGQMVGEGAAVLVARAFAASGTVPPADALARFLAIYDRHLLDHTRPYAGTPETLSTLAGRATLAVLTNKPLGATRRILEGLDLGRYFGAGLVVGGDGPFPRKPDAAGLKHLMEAARSHPSDTLLVGDSFIDWKTARAGLTSICLARYGFGFRGFPLEELGPNDLIIDSPLTLLSAL
jgi:phosphoglycolate phosphatase